MDTYIGITDFREPWEVDEILGTFLLNRLRFKRILFHVGVMMTYKTLNGIQSRWLGVLPQNQKIASIFSSWAAYNCLHFADYDGHPDLVLTLLKAVSYCGPNLRAIQLDMIWPNPNEVREFHNLMSNRVEIILQIGKDALERTGGSPAKVVEFLRPYEGLVSRVLLDKSMGRGIGMDANSLIPYAEAIRSRFPDIGIGAAGGLGPRTLRLVEPLMNVIPDLSIDSQSELRVDSDPMRQMNLIMAETYLLNAIRLYH